MSTHPVPRPHRSAARTVHLGVDLSATAARPPVWRTYDSRPAREFDRETATRLARVAAHGALDFVALGPGFTLGTSRDTALGGVLDPAVAACRIGRHAAEIGLVAHLAPGNLDPQHVAQALAALDEHSAGRAGWQVSEATPEQVDAVRDRWDAILANRPGPDVPEQHVSRDGVRFAVRGHRPGTLPGQPRVPVVVAVPAADDVRVARALELAGRVADVVRVRVSELHEATALRARVRAAAVAAGRRPADVRVLVDLFAVVGPDRDSASARLDLLRRLEDEEVDDGSLVVAGSPVEHAVTIQDWVDAGAADGFVVRPGALTSDLEAFVAAVVPVLQGSGYLRSGYPGRTLRETLGLRGSPAGVVVGS